MSKLLMTGTCVVLALSWGLPVQAAQTASGTRPAATSAKTKPVAKAAPVSAKTSTAARAPSAASKLASGGAQATVRPTKGAAMAAKPLGPAMAAKQPGAGKAAGSRLALTQPVIPQRPGRMTASTSSGKLPMARPTGSRLAISPSAPVSGRLAMSLTQQDKSLSGRQIASGRVGPGRLAAMPVVPNTPKGRELHRKMMVAQRGHMLASVRTAEPARPSVGQATGLHAADDPLDLHSSVAMVMDQRSGEILLAKNSEAILPIASITKIMTALVVLDAQQPLAEMLEISADDIDTEKGSRSRLRPGTRLSRAELLQLALMSSENRAAHALGRHYPGGLEAFVTSMNAKARHLGMTASRFSDPTGLSERNVSNALDLTRMLRAAYDYPLVRQFSTAPELTIDAGHRMISFRNTNRLIDHAAWSIGLQKTGYIAEAGRCLVMQANIDSRPVLMVLLDSSGRYSRFGDAQRIRDWLEAEHRTPAVTRVRNAPPASGGAAPAYMSAGS